jgi:hypothetical protein
MILGNSQWLKSKQILQVLDFAKLEPMTEAIFYLTIPVIFQE